MRCTRLRTQTVPKKTVVEMLRGKVKHFLILSARQSDHILERSADKLSSDNSVIELAHVTCMMLTMMKLKRLRRGPRSEGVFWEW